MIFISEKTARKLSGTIPAMTPLVVHKYLRELGRQWTGQGVAIELGSWLGATAVPLLEGLVRAGYDRPFYAYDRWIANEEQVKKADVQGVTIKNGQSLLPLFRKNVEQVYNKVECHQGNISGTIPNYNGGKIEICLFDAPKRNPVFSNAIDAVAPHWIPGVTVLGLLDYYFYRGKKEKDRAPFFAPVQFINNNYECFERLAEWPDQCMCVFFKYIKKLRRFE